MALRILDDGGRVVEAHGLVVEQRRGERRQVMDLEIRARIRQQREAGGVRFGEAVERERRDLLDDVLLRLRRDAVARHALPQFHLDVAHAQLAALEAHGAAQLLGFAAGKARGDHRHAQQLFLEERHAQSPLQHRFQRRVRVGHRLTSLAALEKRVHHFADDRPRPDDRHLDHDVVKLRRTQARQARHLRAALDLEHADRVRLLERGVHLGIVGGQVREVHLFFVVIANELDGIFQYGHHAQAEQVHLDDAEVGAILLVPLHHDAAGHRRGFQRHHRIQLSLADDHAAGVLSQVARQVLDGEAKLEEFLHARMAQVEAGEAELIF